MVTNNNLDLTMTTIAVVVEAPLEPPQITQDAMTQLLRPPLATGVSQSGETLISSNRDQIEVLFSPNKINVRYQGDDPASAKNLIPRTLLQFLTWYQTDVKSYGVNFVVLVSLGEVDPETWLADNLIAPAVSDRLGGAIIGSKGVSISLEAENKTWNLEFSRSTEGKLMINFNSSEEVGEAGWPPTPNLGDQLDSQYEHLVELVRRLM